MSEIRLGQLIDSKAARDAIHVAICPVTAQEKLFAGQDVAVTDIDGNLMAYTSTDTGACLGIVDPYLKQPVFPDQRFYVFLYPNSVTGMRHHWHHPAFDDHQHDQKESIEWLEDFACSAGMTYAELLEIVKEYCRNGGEPWVQYGSDRARDAWYKRDRSEFWKHFKRVTGLEKPVNPSCAEPFSCSC